MLLNAKISAVPYFFTFMFLSGAAGSNSLAADSVDLKPRAHADAYVRVKTVIEVAGSLNVEAQLSSKEKAKALTIPMEVNADLFFDQRGIAGEHFPAVRHYWDAKATFDINDKTEERELREDRRLIRLNETDSITDRMWSPHGSLTREEVDLLEVPGTAFPPELLLSNAEVEEGTEWTIDSAIVAQFLRLSKVTKGELIATAKEITDEKVKIELSGDLEAQADGAKTKLQVKGNVHFDREAKFVNWVALAIREKRETGFSTPGFEVTARIRTARQSIDSSESIPKGQVTAQAPSVGELLLEHKPSDQPFEMVIDRRWHAISKKPRTTVLRMVDDGQLLATCKIDELNRMPAGKQVTLSGFQNDVVVALGKTSRQIVSSSEKANAQGVRVLRVEAAGQVEKTPIRWIYYHLSNDAGQRLSFIFTHEASMESRLAGADEALTSSVMFIEPDVEQQARAYSEAIR